ncbi:hypothetical protein NC661_13315 [Aquibacillus koreensis]|uniref:Uncharacterized protein n=1 Tax=Aquibacillus koreensis TaxID=279446 RepID=A0A9X3WQ21_9BACI|nr:hypothetical protein [Aquibacillus koreensis]MCT2536300.1 hypothetical protein [Aquibacillus koreensis]MDC3421349.1 hypothetical protein [Aquibacillus koreensis]
MQLGNLNGGQELLCINTEKVYDWILNEANFDLSLSDLDLPLNPITGDQLECDDIDINSVSCTVSPAEVDPIVIVDRVDQQFVVDGAEVTLQLVNIRKNFEVTVFVDLIPELGGATVEVGTADFTRCEQAILCAPEGTDINVTFTDLDCFVCTATCDAGTTTDVDEIDVTVSVRLCQSIQSTYDVTLEITADFCQPRDILPIPPCPTPTIPPQCPIVFPNNENGNNG